MYGTHCHCLCGSEGTGSPGQDAGAYRCILQREYREKCQSRGSPQFGWTAGHRCGCSFRGHWRGCIFGIGGIGIRQTGRYIQLCKKLLQENFVDTHLVEDVANLYVAIKATAGDESAEVEVKEYHSNITKIVKNGEVIFTKEEENQQPDSSEPDKTLLKVKDILEFADTVKIDDVKELLDRQIQYNTAIAQEGLEHPYGAEIGRTLMEDFDHSNVKLQAKAFAAAGSDARMSGCPLPVVINSGSGNQGITASLPVIVYGRYYHLPQEKIYRALCVSNLISIHQKRFIGSLSAYCGATSAGCGSGAGIAYMMGMSYDEICDVITNSIATIGGMVCDGAKSSCAAKIAASVEAALVAVHMAKKHRAFKNGEGLVKGDIEETIAAIGDMGRVGMKSTDVEILNLMLDKKKVQQS